MEESNSYNKIVASIKNNEPITKELVMEFDNLTVNEYIKIHNKILSDTQSDEVYAIKESIRVQKRITRLNNYDLLEKSWKFTPEQQVLIDNLISFPKEFAKDYLWCNTFIRDNELRAEYKIIDTEINQEISKKIHSLDTEDRLIYKEYDRQQNPHDKEDYRLIKRIMQCEKELYLINIIKKYSTNAVENINGMINELNDTIARCNELLKRDKEYTDKRNAPYDDLVAKESYKQYIIKTKELNNALINSLNLPKKYLTESNAERFYMQKIELRSTGCGHWDVLFYSYTQCDRTNTETYRPEYYFSDYVNFSEDYDGYMPLGFRAKLKLLQMDIPDEEYCEESGFNSGVKTQDSVTGNVYYIYRFICPYVHFTKYYIFSELTAQHYLARKDNDGYDDDDASS